MRMDELKPVPLILPSSLFLLLIFWLILALRAAGIFEDIPPFNVLVAKLSNFTYFKINLKYNMFTSIIKRQMILGFLLKIY